MKKVYSILFLFSMMALVATSCDDEAEPSAKSLTFAASSAEVSEDAYDVSLGLALDAPAAQDTEVSFTFGGTATQGSDYIAPEASTITIYKGQSTAALPLRIVLDCVTEPAETIEISLASAGNLSVSGSHTVTIAANSQFHRTRFLGRYKGDEPGYAIYTVNFSAPATASANEIEVDNFWDSGFHLRYQFNLEANTVFIPTQEFVSGSTTYVVSQGATPGIYDPCTYEFTAPYVVKRKSNGATLDINTHTYKPY